MSEQIEGPEAPYTITLKGGAGFESPWLVVRAASAEDAVALLAEATMAELPEKIAEYAADFREKAGAGAPSASGAQRGGSPSPQRGASPRGRQTSSGASAPQSSDVELHPEGLTCHCGGAVQYKKITAKASGKTFEMWVCPNQRSKGDGHFSEFIN